MTYRVGELWKLSIDVTEKDVDGVEQPVNPTSIDLHIVHPNGTTADPTIDNPPLVEGQFPYNALITAEGMWTATWTVLGPDDTRTEWIFVYPAPTAFEPNARDVANIIPRRAVGDDGLIGGTFTDDTRPTGEQVEEIAMQTAMEVLNAIGGQLPPVITGDAGRLARVQQLGRYAAAVGAAAQVELAFFPEDKTNTAQQLSARYQLLLDQLRAVLESYGVDVPGDPGDIGSTENLFVGLPAYSFPEPRTVELGY